MSDGKGAVATWWIEAGVAGLLMATAVLVLADSWRVGLGWGSEGPRSGVFPFLVGLVLLGAAGMTLVRSLLPRLRSHDAFVDREGLGRVLGVLLPAIAFVAAAQWLGLYVAAALLIASFMWLLGRFALPVSLGVGVGIALVLFIVFERWFLMPLPKGPLEAALGF